MGNNTLTTSHNMEYQCKNGQIVNLMNYSQNEIFSLINSEMDSNSLAIFNALESKYDEMILDMQKEDNSYSYD